MHLLASICMAGLLQLSGWEAFTDTEFRWQYSEKLDMDVEVPVFNKKLKEMDGKEFILSGHYIPTEIKGNRIILSKNPYASCFFCGGAGLETVVEIVFESVQRPFRLDEVIKVKGTLKLNQDDLERLVFIIKEAKVIES